MSSWGGRRIARIRALVWRMYGGRCWLCGAEITAVQPWDVDHVLPRSQGGSDELRNLRPAHASCNRSRGARPAGLWSI